MKWIKVQDRNPGYNQIVWGFFKNREVCLVQHSLSNEEYLFHCEEGLWYSIDDEKTGCVSHWMPLQRPYRPDQTCHHCLNPESIMTPETCCTGCSRLQNDTE